MKISHKEKIKDRIHKNITEYGANISYAFLYRDKYRHYMNEANECMDKITKDLDYVLKFA